MNFGQFIQRTFNRWTLISAIILIVSVILVFVFGLMSMDASLVAGVVAPITGQSSIGGGETNHVADTGFHLSLLMFFFSFCGILLSPFVGHIFPRDMRET